MNLRVPDPVLAVVVAANFSQLGVRLLISPVVPAIIGAYGVSKGEIGLVLTGMWGAYALVQFPSGVAGDAYGERAVILASLMLAGLASLLLAASPTFVVFGGLAIVLGLATGPYFTVATSFLAKRFEHTGEALSYHTAGGSLAGVAAPVAAGFVAARFGWRAAIGLGAVVVLPTAAVFAWQIRPTPPERPDGAIADRFEPAAIRELLSRPSVAYTTFIAVTTVFAWQSFASFFPTFLVEHWGFTTERAGVAFGVVFLLSAIAQPVVGSLSDRIDRDAVIAASLLTAASGLALSLVGSSLAAAVAAVGLLGVGISWPGVVQARFMDQFDDAERGSGFGLVRTVYMLLGALGSVVTGTLADAAGWPAAFGLVVALLVVVAASLTANRLLRLGL